MYRCIDGWIDGRAEGQAGGLAGGWICREYTTVRPTYARPLSSKPLPVSGGGSEKKK